MRNQYSPMPLSKATFLLSSTPPKKKRNLPGRPDPDAEVIALSPKTLLATNRFVCEICNKGFQRDQNLQLHQRGHNLPWKLRQGKGKEARKRVYVCPEPSCVHNKPCRALGDLTGIKKHFCRKHGEKKWSCQRCSRKYAVQSDWKAHMKTCGTREYTCHCGNLFSRRDKFIMHRAFCDALAKEGALPTIGGGDNSEEKNVLLASSPPLTPSMSMVSAAMSIQSSGIVENPMNKGATGTSSTSTSIRGFASIFASSTLCCSKSSSTTFSNHMTTSSTATHIPTCLSLSESESCHYNSTSQAPALSATALLQKAAQMGVAASNASLRLQSLGLATTSSSSPEDESISAMLPWNIQLAKQDNNHSVANLMVHSQSQPLTRDLLGLSIDGNGGNASLSALFTSFGESFDASGKH